MSVAVSNPSSHRVSVAQSTTACRLCGEDRFEPVGELDRRGRPLPTVVCRGCGLVSHATIPTDDELARYYAREYRQDYHGEFEPSARRVLREWERGQALFETLRPRFAPGDRVFEVGSGIGCNLKPFQLAGFVARGIEPGEGFCKFSREKLGCDTRQASLGDLPDEPTNDLVLLVHVLEHLNQPRWAFEKIRGLLDDGGRLYVEVPNLAAPHPSLANICHFAHIYNFTPWTLAALGESCGFEVETQLTATRDVNLAILFRKSEQRRPIPNGLYERTREVLDSFNPWSYYSRPSYLTSRVRRFAGHLSERLFSRRRLAARLAQCQAATKAA